MLLRIIKILTYECVDLMETCLSGACTSKLSAPEREMKHCHQDLHSNFLSPFVGWQIPASLYLF